MNGSQKTFKLFNHLHGAENFNKQVGFVTSGPVLHNSRGIIPTAFCVQGFPCSPVTAILHLV